MSSRISPIFIPRRPWSHPVITWPTPALYENGFCPGSLVDLPRDGHGVGIDMLSNWKSFIPEFLIGFLDNTSCVHGDVVACCDSLACAFLDDAVRGLITGDCLSAVVICVSANLLAMRNEQTEVRLAPALMMVEEAVVRNEVQYVDVCTYDRTYSKQVRSYCTSTIILESKDDCNDKDEDWCPAPAVDVHMPSDKMAASSAASQVGTSELRL